MKWAIQYNIFLQTQYSSLRVPKSIWQVGAVYSFLFSFFCYTKPFSAKEMLLICFSDMIKVYAKKFYAL